MPFASLACGDRQSSRWTINGRMKIVAIIFALLGIGLHVRMFGFLVDPAQSADFAFQWEFTSLANRILVIGAMLLPFAFYGS